MLVLTNVIAINTIVDLKIFEFRYVVLNSNQTLFWLVWLQPLPSARGTNAILLKTKISKKKYVTDYFQMFENTRRVTIEWILWDLKTKTIIIIRVKKQHYSFLTFVNKTFLKLYQLYPQAFKITKFHTYFKHFPHLLSEIKNSIQMNIP